MSSKSSGIGAKEVVVGVGGAGAGFLATGASPSGLPILVGMAVGAAIFVSTSINSIVGDRFFEQGERLHSEIQERCASGTELHCGAAVELRRGLASPRSVNPWTGVPLEMRATLGLMFERISATPAEHGTPFALDGTLVGSATDVVLRHRFLRFGLSHALRGGGVIDGDQFAPEEFSRRPTFRTIGASVGLQLRHRVFSPYAELRLRRTNSRAIAYAIGDASPQLYGLSGTDTVAVFGNTFQVTSSRGGPLVRSLVCDVAYLKPLGGSPFSGGFTLSVGVSTRWPVALSEYEEGGRQVTPRDPRTPSYLAYGFLVGGGLEALGQPRPGSRFRMSWANLWAGTDRTFGAWTAGLDWRWPLGGDEELGLTFAPLSLTTTVQRRTPRSGDLVEADGLVTTQLFGTLMTRVYARSHRLGVPVELGLMTPLAWGAVRPRREHGQGELEAPRRASEFRYFSGMPPALLYAGVGL